MKSKTLSFALISLLSACTPITDKFNDLDEAIDRATRESDENADSSFKAIQEAVEREQ